MEKDLISIIMPVYNGEKYLQSCIKSVQAQQYQRWELLAVDDGSCDHSAEIIHTFEKQDSRICLIQTDHKGVSNARMTGLCNSHGTYLMFLDCDDLMSETLLRNLYEKIVRGGWESFVCSILILKMSRKLFFLIKPIAVRM